MVDNVIGDAMRMFAGTLVQIVGTIVLVSIVLPWFLLAVGALLLAYYWVGIFYRASAREIKVRLLVDYIGPNFAFNSGFS